MAQEWYYLLDGEQRGPVSAAELKHLAAEGKLRPDDKVRKGGMDRWVAASQINGLFPPTAAGAGSGVRPRSVAAKAPAAPGGTDTRRGSEGDEEDKTSRAGDRVASWVFGSLLLVFFVWVFAAGPEKLPDFKQRMLAVACALLAGLFSFFMTGTLNLHVKGLESVFGKVGVKATGGLAAFTLVLIWWLSPLAPVGLEQQVADLKADTTAIKEGVGQIEVKLDALAVSIQEKIGVRNLGPEYDKVNYHREYQDEYLKKGGRVEALVDEYRQRGEKHPANAMYRYLLARLYAQKGDLAAAAREARTGYKADPSFRWNRRMLLYNLIDPPFDIAAKLSLEREHYGITDEEAVMLTGGEPDRMMRAMTRVRERWKHDDVASTDLGGDDHQCWHFFRGLEKTSLAGGKAFKNLVGGEAVSEKGLVRVKVLDVVTGAAAIPFVYSTDLVWVPDPEDKEKEQRVNFFEHRDRVLRTCVAQPPVAIRLSVQSANPKVDVTYITDRGFHLFGNHAAAEPAFAGYLFKGTGKQSTVPVQVCDGGADVADRFLSIRDDFWIVIFPQPAAWQADRESLLKFRFTVEHREVSGQGGGNKTADVVDVSGGRKK